MQKYANLSGDSGIDTFLITPSSIKVKFVKNPTVYVYTNQNPGAEHVNTMKRLAEAGKGLATYISQNVKKNYDHKE